jgi:ornithine cyclodeaminase/alanine dehydrogenase-like protein (mu-crystallin family)
MPLWLNEADIRAALSIPDLIDVMESALAAFSAGQVQQPVRTVIELRDREFFAVMPGYAGTRNILGAKLVTVVPSNAGRALHTHLAAIALFDSTTGELLAIADGRYVTEARTAAVSAVSVRHLARADASVLAIVGSGVQARSHLEALRLVRDFREVRAWSPTREHLERFAAETGARAARTAEEAVRGADVVLLATSAVTPVIEDRWVSAGTHVIAIGACRPSQREIDPALVARARLVVDSSEAALRESGDVVQGIAEGRFTGEHARLELGAVVAGREQGRRSAQEVTIFKSLGLAIEDLMAADRAYRRALEQGRGLPVSF